MILATIQILCTICERLLIIAQAQQAELSELGCDPKALDAWAREIAHQKSMLRKLSR